MRLREWMIGQDEAVSRVMGAVGAETVLQRSGETAPSQVQVAAVMHALADHTALLQAVQYRPSDMGVALNVGRWLHALGDYLEHGPVNAPWLISDDEADLRLLAQVHRQSCLTRTGTPAPSRMQTAAVLHSLADFTALSQAVGYVDSPDGPAHAVGRWLHDLGDYFER